MSRKSLALAGVLLGSVLAFTPKAIAANFAGVALTGGGTVRADVALSAIEQSYVSEGGNVVPPHAVAVLSVPPGFDPARSWPVLVILSTSDFKHQNRDDLVNIYRQSGLAEGWVLIAGDGPEPARHDSFGWRAGMTLAALDALHRSFPRSDKWPIACAGYSGGAKRAGLLAPLLSLAGNQLIGIFLTGLNEDRLTDGYRKYKPGPNFLRTPIFLSTGQRIKLPRLSSRTRSGFQCRGPASVACGRKPFPMDMSSSALISPRRCAGSAKSKADNSATFAPTPVAE